VFSVLSAPKIPSTLAAYCKTVGAIHQDEHCRDTGVLSTTSYPTKVSTLTSTVTVVSQVTEVNITGSGPG
jgi:hypothetical protein